MFLDLHPVCLRCWSISKLFPTKHNICILPATTQAVLRQCWRCDTYSIHWRWICFRMASSLSALCRNHQAIHVVFLFLAPAHFWLRLLTPSQAIHLLKMCRLFTFTSIRAWKVKCKVSGYLGLIEHELGKEYWTFNFCFFHSPFGCLVCPRIISSQIVVQRISLPLSRARVCVFVCVPGCHHAYRAVPTLVQNNGTRNLYVALMRNYYQCRIDRLGQRAADRTEQQQQPVT